MNSEKESSAKRIILTMGIIIVILLAAMAAMIYCVWKSYYGRSNYVKDEDVSIFYEIPDENQEETEAEDGSAADFEQESIGDALIKEVEVEIMSAVDNHEIQNENYVYNLLLIGSDRRSATWHGNSDTMILVSVNTITKKIYLTSFMRDLYAVIPGFGAKKLNAAHAHGGGPLLVQTIEENFRIDIDNWASVDFGSLATIINAIGGINMEIYQAEADIINSECGSPTVSAGMMHLNGSQAVSFARIRKVGQSDYERTSRQRRVIEQMVYSLRGMGISQLNQFVNNVLPLVTHNISEGDLIAKIASLPEWITYTVVQDRIPYDGMFGHKGEMLVPDYEATISRLKGTIYATE